MDLNDHIFPEEFVDIVMQEFAYDPIKLSSGEDPSQVLYNRRTLETIWDAKHIAINPYTRQPFQICNVVPQTKLKQQMWQYLRKNECVTLSLRLEVIPDYNRILLQTEMKQLLKELVLAANKCLRLLKRRRKKKRPGHSNRKPNERGLKQWKDLWKKLNLVRLYCQYRPENREVFLSIKGYDYLFLVISTQLLHSCRQDSRSSYNDAEEGCKEVARIVDVMGGLKQKVLLKATERSVSAFVRVLFRLKHSGYLKIRSMVLRIYRGMFGDCIFYPLRSKGFIIRDMVIFGFYVLSRWENPRDIVNEDLYNGMAILKTAWIANVRLFVCPHSVEILCVVVAVCISRLQNLNEVFSALEAQTISSSSGHEDDDNGEVECNIHLISMALSHGLFLIYSLLTTRGQSKEELHRYVARRDTIQRMNLVKQIARMMKLILGESKFIHSSHVWFGLKITESLHRKERNLSRMIKSELVRIVRILQDFLGSKYVNKYGTEIKHLVRYIVHVDNIKFH